jgi:hypothetical protein
LISPLFASEGGKKEKRGRGEEGKRRKRLIVSSE